MPEPTVHIEPVFSPAPMGQMHDIPTIANWQMVYRAYMGLTNRNPAVWAKDEHLISNISVWDEPGPLHTPPWATRVFIFSTAGPAMGVNDYWVNAPYRMSYEYRMPSPPHQLLDDYLYWASLLQQSQQQNNPSTQQVYASPQASIHPSDEPWNRI